MQTTTIQPVAAQWYECITRFEKTMPNGQTKKVTETYTVCAYSFTEAETRIEEKAREYALADYELKNINPAPYREVIFSNDAADDCWYLARIDFFSIDEKTEKQKRTPHRYLIQAADFDKAKSYVKQLMAGSIADYIIHSIKETKIVDVFVK